MVGDAETMKTTIPKTTTTTTITKTTTIITIKLFYDEYEANHGDGFYPQLTEQTGFISDQIQFIYLDKLCIWMQRSSKLIKGLDPPYGQELLDELNKHIDSKLAARTIANLVGLQIWPRVSLQSNKCEKQWQS